MRTFFKKNVDIQVVRKARQKYEYFRLEEILLPLSVFTNPFFLPKILLSFLVLTNRPW